MDNIDYAGYSGAGRDSSFRAAVVSIVGQRLEDYTERISRVRSPEWVREFLETSRTPMLTTWARGPKKVYTLEKAREAVDNVIRRDGGVSEDVVPHRHTLDLSVAWETVELAGLLVSEKGFLDLLLFLALKGPLERLAIPDEVCPRHEFVCLLSQLQNHNLVSEADNKYSATPRGRALIESFLADLPGDRS